MHTLSNILSLTKIITAFILFILILSNTSPAFFIATILFLLAAITDFLDGYLAQKFKSVSSLGVFLDLTGDKVLVSSIVIALLSIAVIPAWIVLLIITREFLVTGLRSMATTKGKVIPAGKLGKQKTVITFIALGGLLFAKALENQGLLQIANVFLLVATAWTIVSAIAYFRNANLTNTL